MIDVIKFILNNQLTEENAPAIIGPTLNILSDHDRLIRELALYVSEGNAGTGEERKALLGTYYDEVQKKITWAYNTAQDVWAGKYPNGEANRRKVFGADFELVQWWVNHTRPAIYVPSNLKYKKDMNGRRYMVSGVPTAKGTITYRGYDQHNQGSNPYRFDGSGCGFMSFYTVISTIKGYGYTPKAYADKVLTAITKAKECPISIWAGCKLLDNENIKYEWVKGPLTTDGCRKDIQAHLEKGMPVIISLSIYDRKGKAHKGRYTNYAHYAPLIGTVNDKSWYLLDSGWQKPRYVDAYDICEYIPGTSKNPTYDPIWNGFNNAAGYVKVYM